MKRRGLTIREMRTLDAAHTAIQSAALAVKTSAEAVLAATEAMNRKREPEQAPKPNACGFEVSTSDDS